MTTNLNFGFRMTPPVYASEMGVRACGNGNVFSEYPDLRIPVAFLADRCVAACFLVPAVVAFLADLAIIVHCCCCIRAELVVMRVAPRCSLLYTYDCRHLNFFG